MKTKIAITKNEGNIIIRASNDSNEYFLWQIEEDNRRQIYFEYNDQINGGYNIIKEITIMFDGMHLVSTSGDLLHFYLNNLFRSEYRELLNAIENIYIDNPDVLDVIDK